MSKKANPAAVGGFVLGAIALVVAGVVFIGGTTFFAPTEYFVIFFDGSVNGLQVGAPVKMQGVPIGQVTAIHAIAEREERKFTTETRIMIDRAQFHVRGADPRERETPTLRRKRLEELIQQGLRARLELQSFITGQLYISVDFYPDTEVRLVGLAGEDIFEIPAVPSTSQELARKVREVLAKLQEIDIDQTFDRLNSALAGVDKFVSDPEFRQLSANANRTLEEGRGTLVDARHLVANVDDRLGPISDSAANALNEGDKTFRNVNSLIKPGSPLVYQISQTLQEVSDAARAIRVLATFVEENPNAIVFGRSRGN
jgi:paraquat-inducible protein B